MRTHTPPSQRTKNSRSSFELCIYALLCLGVAACGDKDPVKVDNN